MWAFGLFYRSKQKRDMRMFPCAFSWEQCKVVQVHVLWSHLPFELRHPVHFQACTTCLATFVLFSTAIFGYFLGCSWIASVRAKQKTLNIVISAVTLEPCWACVSIFLNEQEQNLSWWYLGDCFIIVHATIIPVYPIFLVVCIACAPPGFTKGNRPVSFDTDSGWIWVCRCLWQIGAFWLLQVFWIKARSVVFPFILFGESLLRGMQTGGVIRERLPALLKKLDSLSIFLFEHDSEPWQAVMVREGEAMWLAHPYQWK